MFEDVLFSSGLKAHEKSIAILKMDGVLGLGLASLNRNDLRIRPKAARITETEIELLSCGTERGSRPKGFRQIRRYPGDDLIAKGVEVMDGDPLGWDWKLEI